jgi:hypothetical protein
MVEVEVLVKSIEGSRLVDEAQDVPEATFDVSAFLSETERNPGQLGLKFSVSIQTQPPVAKIDISGLARISGEEAEIDAALTPKGEESTPPIFLNIYQKVYAVLYLLAGSLKIPYPSPGLMKTVKVASPREIAAEAKDKQG